MSVLEGLKPERVFYYFEKLTQIPHGSRNTKAISDYLVQFAKEQGLSCSQDASNNVIIRKSASAGYEAAVGVILQGHCDMVCEKKPGSAHDFEKDALSLGIDGDDIYAKDTTLGGDDGIAVAYMMAILENQELKHPALECVITTDEEVGLLGAYDLDCSQLKGRRLINLDSEAEGSIWVSCAGGMTSQCSLPVNHEMQTGVLCQVVIDGLLGGHSGAEIDKNRASSNILMGRFLYELEHQIDFGLRSAQGGNKDNAIPRMTAMELVVNKEDIPALESFAAEFQETLRAEYAHTDDGISTHVICKEQGEYETLTAVSREKIIFFLMNIPNGIQKMSGSIEGLVETSCNLGVFHLPEKAECMTVSCSVRSSVGSAKVALGEKICYLTEFLGGECFVEGDYPAWEYRTDSPLRDLMVEVFEEMYQKKPEVVAIHAGLECGLFYDRLDNLDCASVGPNMKDIHTSEERLSISSTARVYEYLLKVLEAMKE